MAYRESESSFSSQGTNHSQTLSERQLQRTDSEGNEEDTDGGSQASQASVSGNKKLRLFLRAVIGGVLFLVVLTCITFSKLTLITLTNELRHLTVDNTEALAASRVYWQLLFILVLPHCLTFVRSAFIGVIGKKRSYYPWPRKSALIAGGIASFAEVVAMSTFVFSVLCFFTPELSLLSMQAVFMVQFAIDIYHLPWSQCNLQTPRRSVHIQGSYETIGNDEEESQLHNMAEVVPTNTRSSSVERWRVGSRRFFQLILENKLMRCAALALQISGVVGLLVLIMLKKKAKPEDIDIYLPPVIGLPISITILSFLWSNKVQEFLLVPQQGSREITANARYKANFLNSLYRICLYPLVSYGIFHLVHYGLNVHPWEHTHLHHFLGSEKHLFVFLAQIFTSLAGYIFAWVACTMTLRTLGFALPLLCSTPMAILIALSTQHLFLPEFSNEHFLKGDSLYYVTPCVWFVMYLGQVLGMGYFLCTKSNLIVSQDKDTFLNPHYDGVFLEQYLALNRQVNKYSKEESHVTEDGQLSSRRAIFICSTMYHENVREMRQMLKSIKRMSEWYSAQERDRKDLVESHIFFDGAVSGGQLTQYALQLLSLVDQCLGVSVTRCIRKDEPYGQSMSWDIGGGSMKFTVHFKDNFKVKNKKRWSQVMYMNYVIKFRIKQSKNAENPKDRLDEDNTFILTTDADIDFTAESAMVLLDSLASNKEVGAVCARTHPKGSGALYWYQVFDYAIGHWFWKPAEHFFGSVLCCPGCFSVFRCKALATVLEQYSSEVKGATDFLTKDMGEDRWLCTLLIQRGWRLDYCAISEDYTYCPEAFDEFYKQRRRWVPSTLANLLLLISKAGTITRENNSVSTLFVLLQGIMAFSTAISPATVILIIASGLQGAYKISNGAVLTTIIVLSLMSILYGIVCLYTSQKTQIDLAKVLTFLFAIVMAVVIAGLLKEVIFEIFPTGDFSHVQLPKSPTTWYLALFAFTFVLTAVLHLGEWTCLVHFIWYLLALPSGYLLLLIYSAANLDSQSWGTRENATAKAGGGGGGFVIVKKWFWAGLKSLTMCCCQRKSGASEQKVPLLQEMESTESSDEEKKDDVYPVVDVDHKQMDRHAEQWLREQECFEYKENFEEHGYWSLSYISSMKKEDFKAIGVKQQGFLLRLEKAAKKLPAMFIETKVPGSVTEWLCSLEMEEYTGVFHRAGYKGEADIENLKQLDENELRKMGIVKRAHVKRLTQAVGSLFHPTSAEVQIYKAKSYLNKIKAIPIDDAQAQFWRGLVSNELKPVTVRLKQTSKEIGQKLKTLRNSTLAMLLMINILWIILLYTVTFSQLEQYNLPDKAFTLLFLVVYGVIITVSFMSMLAHRFLMLMQFLGRPEVVKEAIHPRTDEWTHLTIRVPQ